MNVGYVCENCQKGKVFMEVVQCCSHCGKPLTHGLEIRNKQLEKTIRRWSAPTGVHRSCGCFLCEALRALVEPDGEGGE